mmetsp:Transcript_47746/g.91293  ORF Transcript_47746/g.91293 Transcript_47746/m.91293 type:complete len:318 (-) Transcript_47746:267-1220(-)
MGHVVDGQDGARLLVNVVGAVLGGDVHAQQRGVPVVGHKHTLVSVGVPPELQLQGHLARHQREQGEAEEVVPVGAVLVAVGRALAAVARVAQEHKVHAFLVLMPQLHRHFAPEQVHGDVLPSVGHLLVQFLGLGVQVHRGNHHGAMAALRERRWQRACHVAETASLGPGGNLRADEDDAQGIVRLGHVRPSHPLGVHLVRLGRGGCRRVLRHHLAVGDVHAAHAAQDVGLALGRLGCVQRGLRGRRRHNLLLGGGLALHSSQARCKLLVLTAQLLNHGRNILLTRLRCHHPVFTAVKRSAGCVARPRCLHPPFAELA